VCVSSSSSSSPACDDDDDDDDDDDGDDDDGDDDDGDDEEFRIKTLLVTFSNPVSLLIWEQKLYWFDIFTLSFGENPPESLMIIDCLPTNSQRARSGREDLPIVIVSSPGRLM
jgi:hypothetical protein